MKERRIAKASNAHEAELFAARALALIDLQLDGRLPGGDEHRVPDAERAVGDRGAGAQDERERCERGAGARRERTRRRARPQRPLEHRARRRPPRRAVARLRRVRRVRHAHSLHRVNRLTVQYTVLCRLLLLKSLDLTERM